MLSTRGALCDAGTERTGGMVRFGGLGKARAGEVLTVTGRSSSSREAHGGQVLRLVGRAWCLVHMLQSSEDVAGSLLARLVSAPLGRGGTQRKAAGPTSASASFTSIQAGPPYLTLPYLTLPSGECQNDCNQV